MSVEFYKGSQRLAPYCSRFSKGTAVAREKEQLSLFSPPFIKPVLQLTADELFYKSAPTPAAGAPENRDAVLLARDFTELDLLISRREEWMASECLFTGKVKCLDGDTSEIVAELIVMGKNAADAFESNQNVLAAYDNLRIAAGTLAPKNLTWGVQSLGAYRGLPLYVNESEYQDSDGSMKPFVPVDNVLAAPTSLAGCFSYAGVPQVDADERSLRV